MDKSSIYSKTGKGLLEVKNRSKTLSRDLFKLLTLIDGKSGVTELQEKLGRASEKEVLLQLRQLSDLGFIKQVHVASSPERAPAPPTASYVDDLDFAAVVGVGGASRPGFYTSAETEQKAREEAERKAAEARAARAREEAERRAREEIERLAREEVEKRARAEAEARAKAEAERRAREEAEQRARQEAELRARLAMEAKARIEAERKAREDAERRAREEAERRARLEEEARRKLEEERKRMAEEKQRLEAEARKVREEAERKLKEEQERIRREEEERKRREEEERRRKEEEERKRREEEEERRRKEEEERKRREEEEERRRKEEEERKRRKEEEERKRREEEEERRRREEEERRRKEEEERKRREEEERKRREEEERKRREEEERRRKEEEERKRREKEEERRRKEEEERRRREEEERRALEEERTRLAEEKRRLEEEARRVREEAERRLREEQERLRREEEERLGREEAELQARQEALRRQREEIKRRGMGDPDPGPALAPSGRAEAQAFRDETAGAGAGSLHARHEDPEVRRSDDDARGGREEAPGPPGWDPQEAREVPGPSPRATVDIASAGHEESRRPADILSPSRVPAPVAMPADDLAVAAVVEIDLEAQLQAQEEEMRRALEEQERRQRMEDEAREAMERAEREAQERAAAEARQIAEEALRAKEEAERRAREEAAARAREEAARKAQEKEERRKREEEARKRAEIVRQEHERRMREEALARQRKEQEERDRKKAELARMREATRRTPLNRAKPFLLAFVAVVALVLGTLQFMPMASYVPAFEGAVSRRIGEPVSIATLRMSVLSGLEFELNNVKIGKQLDITVNSIKAYPDIASLFGKPLVIKRLEVDAPSLAAEQIGRVVSWVRADQGGQGEIVVRRVQLRGVKLAVKGVNVPAFDAEVGLSPAGEFKGGTVRLSDGTLKVELTPDGPDTAVEVSGRGFTLPAGPQVVFDDFVAKGIATAGELTLSQFEGLLYGGTIKGAAKASWASGWRLEGEFETGHVELYPFMGTVTKDAKSSGQLDSSVRFQMAAPEVAGLYEAPNVQATFTLRKGNVDGVDLVRALQSPSRDGIRGGKSRFDELSGTLAVSDGRYQYRNLRLVSGLLVANGQFDILPNQDVTGRVLVELKSTNRFRGNFAVMGTLKSMMLKP
jgi:hypothetical protein